MVNRIRELLETRQLSPTQFADLIGVGRPVISHILSERNKPSLEVVQKVIGAFPDVSLSWLMSGTGPMLTTAPSAAPTPVNAPAPIAPPATATVAVAPAPATSPVVPPVSFIPPPAAPIPVSPRMPEALATAVTQPIVAAVPATQPSRLPQPPKFRPGAKYALSSELVPPVAPAPTLTTTEAQTATAPIAPAPVPEPLIAEALSLPPAQPIAVPATPAFSELPSIPAYSAGVGDVGPAPTSTPVPATVTPTVQIAAALPAPSSNPAAAFSFLGEAGKTIRRIVLFYSDGSFSDYRPEGQ